MTGLPASELGLSTKWFLFLVLQSRTPLIIPNYAAWKELAGNPHCFSACDPFASLILSQAGTTGFLFAVNEAWVPHLTHIALVSEGGCHDLPPRLQGLPSALAPTASLCCQCHLVYPR